MGTPKSPARHDIIHTHMHTHGSETETNVVEDNTCAIAVSSIRELGDAAVGCGRVAWVGVGWSKVGSVHAHEREAARLKVGRAKQLAAAEVVVADLVVALHLRQHALGHLPSVAAARVRQAKGGRRGSAGTG